MQFPTRLSIKEIFRLAHSLRDPGFSLKPKKNSACLNVENFPLTRI